MNVISPNFFTKAPRCPTCFGVIVDSVYENRLYRGLDKLLPKKDELEMYLKNKLGNLFDLGFDLLLYDVYFEGLCNGNPLAKHGHSRERRGD